ncbi:PadR family transcriptional regulator [Argonema galeatum]|uniref:PadR family transcriptional regulator n=1 Tax=Argonema galeatum TaxID=2942762 RepID=UPI0020115AD1|nr:helix-turn-helix transcriptional regulator [Argonema galeatum]MCL1464551.1 PadR family transcriptional regulator [Argonema galeatum A003/A1]
MLELATLGLLLREPLHGYRLKQQLELFMSSCISVNYGAIYPLLRRLEERGDIVTLMQEPGEAGPSRKIYEVTATGRDRWRQEMLGNPHESWVNTRSRFMIKFFFFNDLEPTERLKLLEHRLMVCRLRLESLEIEPMPPDRYQADAWRRHFSMLQAEIDWLQEQISKEPRSATPEQQRVITAKSEQSSLKNHELPLANHY